MSIKQKTPEGKAYWIIRGMNSLSVLYEHKIYFGQITRRQLEELLKTLTAKISLTEKEIISSYAKKRTKAHSNFLEVKYMEGSKFMCSCGTNPYVTAHIEYE